MIFNAGRLQPLGFVRKLHGFNGGLKAVAQSNALLNIKEPVFFLFDGKPVPFFISALEGNEDEPILFLEEINSEEKAKIFLGKEYFQQGDPEQQFSTDQLIGWSILDKGHAVGKVLGIIPRPHQLLLEVSRNEGTVLIPLAEEWIVEIDEENATLNLDLPEGILEINE
ncbi:MAG: hypothetical protein H6606_09165 [Flavobacteriales bacterium]|nr:hypothetical protein [Flavobacteriales bacterium]